MKKLVLAFVAIAAVSFASCNDKKNAAGNNDTAAVDTAAVDTAAAAAADTAAADTAAHM